MWMNKEFGWEVSLVVLASISISLLLLLPILNSTNKKNSNVQDFGNSLQQTIMFSLKERNYILLISGFFVCGFHVTFIALHLPADLISKGISAEIAGWSLAIIGVTNIIGTLGFGWLGGKVKKPMPLSIIYLLRAVTITIFVLSLIIICGISLFISTRNKLNKAINSHLLSKKILLYFYLI